MAHFFLRKGINDLKKSYYFSYYDGFSGCTDEKGTGRGVARDKTQVRTPMFEPTVFWK